MQTFIQFKQLKVNKITFYTKYLEYNFSQMKTMIAIPFPTPRKKNALNLISIRGSICNYIS